jgi:hypothetical protein
MHFFLFSTSGLSSFTDEIFTAIIRFRFKNNTPRETSFEITKCKIYSKERLVHEFKIMEEINLPQGQTTYQLEKTSIGWIIPTRELTKLKLKAIIEIRPQEGDEEGDEIKIRAKETIVSCTVD